jgi:hypothetical protein
MSSVSARFCDEVKSFVQDHKLLCILTLGLAVVGYSLGNLAGRTVSWICKCYGATEKTRDAANQVFSKETRSEMTPADQSVLNSTASPNKLIKFKTIQIASLPITETFSVSPLVYLSEDLIKEKKGVLLTKNCNPFIGHEDYVGIVALPEGDGYCLHLCPGGGNMSFNRDQINQLMSEAIEKLVIDGITITKITGSVGRHPGDTMKHFQEWQADQLK